MPEFQPKYKPFGERAIYIEWPQEINEKVFFDLLNFKKAIQDYYIEQTVEIIHSYSSITICYISTIRNTYDEISRLKTLYSEKKSTSSVNSNSWKIPVCYEPEFGWDIESLANEKKLDLNELIAIHSKPLYRVYFMGFLPGFLYLGGMDPILNNPRLNEPRFSVPDGAVGIAENQTGIYPQESPGGWNIIGRTPLKMFEPDLSPPCFAKAGDYIQFVPVSMEVFHDISDQISSGRTIKELTYDQG